MDVRRYNNDDTLASLSSQSYNDFRKSMQTWYFAYYMPSEFHIIDADFDFYEYLDTHGDYFDFSEDFWIKDGYLVLNFDITWVKDGQESSRQNISYYNGKLCGAANNEHGYSGGLNMWKTEKPEPEQAYCDGMEEMEPITTESGDVALIYQGWQIRDDLTSGWLWLN